MKPPVVQLTERVFAVGPQRWKVTATGKWWVQVFGSWPFGDNPRYGWIPVEKVKVPRELLDAAGR